MNLKVKATLLWVLALVVSTITVVLIFVGVILTLTYPEIVFSIFMGVFMVYTLISAWMSIYHYLKSKEEK